MCCSSWIQAHACSIAQRMFCKIGSMKMEIVSSQCHLGHIICSSLCDEQVFYTAVLPLLDRLTVFYV